MAGVEFDEGVVEVGVGAEDVVEDGGGVGGEFGGGGGRRERGEGGEEEGDEEVVLLGAFVDDVGVEVFEVAKGFAGGD